MKTSELNGPALDWAVAKCESRALRDAIHATDEEAALHQLPFTMFDVDYADSKWVVREITVVRFGCQPGCSLPSITAFRNGKPFQATVSMYFWTREEAELDCLASNNGDLEGYSPSTDWSQGGPIIEQINGVFKYNKLVQAEFDVWGAHTIVQRQGCNVAITLNGPTPLVAAMRCYVASKLGNDVEIPKELL